MQRPPRNPNEPLLSRFLVWRVFLVSRLFVAGIFILYDWHYRQDTALDYARTIAVNALVVFQVAYLLKMRSLVGTVLSWQGLLSNRWLSLAAVIVIALQLLYTYAPPMQTLFESRGLQAMDWLGFLALSVCVFFIVVTEKAILRRFSRRRRTSKRMGPI